MRRRTAVSAGLTALACAAAGGMGASGAMAATGAALPTGTGAVGGITSVASSAASGTTGTAGTAGTTGTAGTATSWTATATQAVPTGTGVTSLGALPGSTPVTVQVVLGLRNASALKQDIAEGMVLSPSSFMAQFAPTGAQVQSVEGYLKAAGVTPSAVTGNNTIISASGSAAAIQSAFDTTLARVKTSTTTGYANLTAASVPSALGSTVVSVLGLNDVFAMKTMATPKATNPPSSCVVTGVGYPCTYNPQGLQKAYDATSAPTGSKTPEAIFAEGDLTQVVKDLSIEQAANGLPSFPVSIYHSGIASSDTSGADEWDLDTQYSTGMAQDVKSLTLYDATTLTDSDLALSFADFASLDKQKAGSASFGECEVQASIDGSMLADDEQFAEAAVQGQTVFASAGDTGGFCTVAPTNGVPAGVPDVEYPASSPYVVGVGGTTLVTTSTGAYSKELAWVAGGGGISYFESAPAWQAGDGYVGTIASKADLRTVPDISMDADPNSGANVYVDGTPEGVGGTSLASPLSLGVWDRIESAHNESVPFASPLLYAANGSAAFHDVTLGDTGPYPATPGYDLATGIGTFDVAKAASIIK